MGTDRGRGLFLLPLALCLGAGCIHVHTDAAGKVKSVELKASSSADEAAAKADGGVKQASATAPAGFTLPSLPKMPTLPSLLPSAGPPTVVLAMFEPGVTSLPDPTNKDAPTPGLVGRLFFFGAGERMPFAPADGAVTITMADESSGKPAETPIGSWTFDKSTLARLLARDGRFGSCYQVFLPWPDYKPGVATKVRMTVKYNPEGGTSLIAPAQTVALDGDKPVSAAGTVTFGGGPAGLGSLPPPGAGFGLPGGNPSPHQFGGFGLPAGGGPVAPTGGPPPAGLPPIAFTGSPRR